MQKDGHYMPLELGAAINHPVTAASSGEEGEHTAAPTTPASPPTPSQTPPHAPLTPPRVMVGGGENPTGGQAPGEPQEDPIAVANPAACEASS